MYSDDKLNNVICSSCNINLLSLRSSRPVISKRYTQHASGIMHYIRFLKPPTIEVKKSLGKVSALITIATDLGDDFLAIDVKIWALLVRDDKVLASRDFLWKPGMRTLPVNVPEVPLASLKTSVKLLVSIHKSVQNSLLVLSLQFLPEIVNVWSEPFSLHDCGRSSGFERRLIAASDTILSLGEDPKESIARHIW